MVQATNFDQNIHMRFEGFGNHSLVKDSDGDFTTDPAQVGILDSDGVISVAASAFSGYPYFTLTTTDISVPVGLLNFNASVQGDGTVVLNWQTVSEKDNDHFTVERSKEGYSWEVVDKIKGAGNSQSLQGYGTADTNPLMGLSHYRLKQTDYDGRFSYSWVRAVIVNILNDQGIKIYPNPAQDRLFVAGKVHEIMDVRLYNPLGQEVTQSLKMKFSNDGVLEIDLTGLAKGIYLLSTTSESITVLIE